MSKPKWSREEPIGVFRAPWHNNWPAAVTLAMTLAILVPIPLLMNGYSAAAAAGLGIQCGVAAGVGSFVVFSALTFLYPVRLYPEGLRGFEKRGRPLVAGWSDIGDARPDHSYGVPFYRYALRGKTRDLWLPQAIVHHPDFRRRIRSVAPPDHVLLGMARSHEESGATEPPTENVAPPQRIVVAPQPGGDSAASAGSTPVGTTQRQAVPGRSAGLQEAAVPPLGGRRLLAYVCGASVMAAAAVAMIHLGQRDGARD
jgi:hypothetical protein